jgi:BlaI family penicillinase repressor
VARTKIRDFSRRERQIMDIVYRVGEATAAEVMGQMPEAPGYSTVRTLLGVLERKGHLNHQRRGHHYVYSPTTSVEAASSSMLEHVMETFFDGSASRIVSAVLDISDAQLSKDEYDEILAIVRQAKAEDR